tara:strand:+ start:467 stop:589 length:123 start_codon:yes stop_codon:yes gene_type:complete
MLKSNFSILLSEHNKFKLVKQFLKEGFGQNVIIFFIIGLD